MVEIVAYISIRSLRGLAVGIVWAVLPADFDLGDDLEISRGRGASGVAADRQDCSGPVRPPKTSIGPLSGRCRSPRRSTCLAGGNITRQLPRFTGDEIVSEPVNRCRAVEVGPVYCGEPLPPDGLGP